MSRILSVLAGVFPVGAVWAAQLVCGGLVESFKYETPTVQPVYFGGWSRAEGVNALEYCLYADVYYADGSVLWAQRADFRCGTHDWEYASYAFTPEKPVSRIAFYAFVRDGVGKAAFKDVFLKREAPRTGEVLWSRRFTDQPYSDSDVVCELYWNGRRAAHRNRKTDERDMRVGNPLPEREIVVWTADSMRRVTPLTFPDAQARAHAPSVQLELARNERESFQVIVSTGSAVGLHDVSLALTPLTDAEGRTLDATVTWQRQGYLARRPPYKAHPFEAPVAERWLPEPLLPAAPFTVRPGGSQGTWVTVFASRQAAPGLYHGTVAVRSSDGGTLARVPLCVRVRRFALPETFGLKTSFTYMDGFTKALFPDRWTALRREAHDLLLDHRLNPDDITRTDLTPVEDIAHMKARGAKTWNLVQIAPPKSPKAKWLWRPKAEEVFSPGFYVSFTNRLAPHVAELKKRGLLDGAYLYGFDECGKEYHDGMRALYLRLKRDFPELPILTTASVFSDLCRGALPLDDAALTADWFCGSMRRYRPETADLLRERGRQVWWYTSLNPCYPNMNFANWEYPFVEGRLLLGFCTWLYRADGFLFWHSNFWREGTGAVLDEMADTFFPGFNMHDAQGCPGDGIFLYPGKGRVLSGIRLANARDGEEDWEYLALAERKVGRTAVERLVRRVVRARDDFSRDPAVVREVRRQLADLIEK